LNFSHIGVNMYLEHVDLASGNPNIVAKMKARMEEIEKTLFSPNRGSADPRACDAAANNYNYHWGPWINVN